MPLLEAGDWHLDNDTDFVILFLYTTSVNFYIK